MKGADVVDFRIVRNEQCPGVFNLVGLVVCRIKGKRNLNNS